VVTKRTKYQRSFFRVGTMEEKTCRRFETPDPEACRTCLDRDTCGIGIKRDVEMKGEKET